MRGRISVCPRICVLAFSGEKKLKKDVQKAEFEDDFSGKMRYNKIV